MFAAEFEPADDDRRSAVSVDAHYGSGGMGRALCKVMDVSIGGVRLSTYTALRRGQAIWLTLPEIGLVIADVMWCNDFAAGCQFRKELTAAQLALLVAQDG